MQLGSAWTEPGKHAEAFCFTSPHGQLGTDGVGGKLSVWPMPGTTVQAGTEGVDWLGRALGA